MNLLRSVRTSLRSSRRLRPPSRPIFGLMAAMLGTVAILLPNQPSGAQPIPSAYNLYLHGFLSDRLSGYRASDNGPVHAIAGSVPSGFATWPQAASPDGRFLLVASSVSPRLHVYAVRDGGRLVPVSGRASALPDTPVDVVVSPDSRRAYVIMGLSKASILTLNLHPNGYTTPVGVATEFGKPSDGIGSAVVSPDGKSLYAASYLRDELLRFSILPDGTVSPPLQRVRTGSGPIYPTFTPGGRLLYVSNERGNSVSGFSVSQTGTLTPVPGTPFRSGLLPHVMSVSPDGSHLYVPNMGSNFISTYHIGISGSLRPITEGRFSSGIAGPMPEASVMSPTGKTLWVLGTDSLAGGSTLLRRFHIRGDGTLDPDPSVMIKPGSRVADGRTLTVVPGH